MKTQMNQFHMNFLTNLMVLAVSTLIGFYLVPYYIDNMGISAYALIPMTTSIAGFVVLVSDAANGSVQRYIALDVSNEDSERMQLTFNTALFGTSGLLLLMIPICLIIAFWSSKILVIWEIKEMSIALVMVSVLMISIIYSWTGNFHNLLFAKNRLDLINWIKIAQLATQLILIVILFSSNQKNLTSYVISYGVSVVIMSFLSVLISLKICPIKISYNLFDSNYFHEILRLSAWNILNTYGNLLFLDASLILSGFLLDMVAEGQFSIIAKMIAILISINTSIAYAFSPLIYRAYAKKEYMKMNSLCLDGIKVTGITMSAITAFICVFYSDILGIWLGSEYSEIHVPILIMTMILAVSCTVAPTYCTSMMTMKLKWPAIATFSFGLLNIVLAVIFVIILDWGLLGLATSWSIALFLKNCIFNTMYHSKILFGNYHGLIPSQLMGVVAFLCFTGYFLLANHYIMINNSIAVLLLIFAPVLAIVISISVRIIKRTSLISP